MIGLGGKRSQPGNQIARREPRPLGVAGIRHGADNAVFYDGAACPAELGLGRPTDVRPLVEGMVWIKQGDDDVHIQQGARGLHALLVLYLLNMVERDNLAAGGQHGDAAAQGRGRFRRWRIQTTPREVGNHLASRAAIALRQSLSRLQHVIGDVQSCSHASDAITSPHHGQERLSLGIT